MAEATGFIERAGVPLAYAHVAGAGPTIVFLPGYRSDMAGEKAASVARWGAANGRAVLRLDYAGCGESGGAFEDGTLASWRDDALAVIDAIAPGPLVLIGSSMGGWLMLLIALARMERVKALIGTAAAPDFTDWGFDEGQRATLLRDGRLDEPSAYSDEPMTTMRGFWESGQANLLLDKPIPLACPVRLLHGQRDADVPWAIALRLAEALGSDDVQLALVKDGDHRLSRAQDIALLLRTLESLPA